MEFDDNRWRSFCGHDIGTFFVKGSQATKIGDVPGTWTFKSIQKKKIFYSKEIIMVFTSYKKLKINGYIKIN